VLDELVCIERTRPTPPRMRLIVNLTTPADRELEEGAITLAASIIHAADQLGFEIGLTLAGLDVPTLLIRRSHWHHARIMSALAAIDLDAPRLTAEVSPGVLGERAAQVVVHPDRVEPALGREDALHLTARQMQRLVTEPLVAPPAVDAEPDAEVAA
jgi:hypothetical protein